jgi:hypothetical protein
MRAFKDEWFQIEPAGWVQIDGSGTVSPETARTLRDMRKAVRE